MVKRYSHSEVTFQRWLKDGRGSGRQSEYKPWLTVRDLPSQGRSHRVFGHKALRIHHLFSDLELAVFLLLEWQRDVIEIREQFPLQRELTLEIAEQHGIIHPAISGVPQYMSSDFLVDTSRANEPRFALQAKYSSELQKPRVIEKLELERRYWEQKGVPWHLITEKEIPAAVLANIKWLYPAQHDELSEIDLAHRTNFYSHHFAQSKAPTLIDLAKSLDVAYDLPLGESLGEIRQLLAQRCFLFDIHIAFRKLAPTDIVTAETVAMQEILHVQGQ